MSEQTTEAQRLEVLRDYATGRAGTRETVANAGLQDYADLVIAMAQAGLDFPKPSDTPARRANVQRASAILQPLLRHVR